MPGTSGQERSRSPRSVLPVGPCLSGNGPQSRGPARLHPRQGTRRQSALAAVGFILGACAAIAAPCQTCHPARAAEQATSRHANALKRYDGANFAGKTLRERGGTLYAYSAAALTVTRDNESRQLPIQWIFGAGHFAQTLLAQQDNRWIEHRISHYTQSNRLSLTPGHSPQPADSFDMAFGILQSEANAKRCFACHSTKENDPGIHCQRCHGEGENHPQKPTIGRTKAVALCAECHRSPNREYASPQPEVEDPASIRFAPVGLTVSKCYTASKGALTCVTCHNPHTNVQPAASYDRTCHSCHSPKAKTACPRQPNCASCHMPQSSPIPLLTFTDHRIR